jgi:P-type Cu+ transporter
MAGNHRLLAEAGIDTADMEAQAEALAGDGKTHMLVAVDGKLAGLVAITDTVPRGRIETGPAAARSALQF